MLVFRKKTILSLGLGLVLLAGVALMGTVVPAYAESSSSMQLKANSYYYYSVANTVRKSITAYVKVDAMKGAAARCIGGNPRIYIAPRGSLKKSGGFTFNDRRVASGGTWACRVSAKTVAGISYYAKGQFKFGNGAGYYGPRDTMQTANLKAIV